MTLVSGTRVALRGRMEASEKTEAEDRLKEAGCQLVSAVSTADVVVSVGELPNYVRKSAEKHGKDVVELEAYLAAIALTGADPATPIAELPTRTPVEASGDRVRILDLAFKRRMTPGPYTPSLHNYRHFCLDGPTLRTARTVALAAAHGMPCLLEGETATSKTSVIHWVAALANAEVVRLNLNGQTDTSELIGRYVPGRGLPKVDVGRMVGTFLDWSEESQAMLERARESAVDGQPSRPLTAEQRAIIMEREKLTSLDQLGHLDLVHEETYGLLRRAHRESRPLTDEEIAQVATNEGLATPTWEFIEGVIPQAMRHGWWVILDELNLAEPQVLERLNPVLERPPSLVLTEGDGTRFGHGGSVPVHPGFRMFATMNPASYAGRTALSPAYRDRWMVSRFVEMPDEDDLYAMLRNLVFGEQPESVHNGVIYKAEPGPAVWPMLAGVADADKLLSALAVFHASVASASGVGGGAAKIGRTRRERYVYTRRTLLATLELLSSFQVVNHDGEQVGVAQEAGPLIRDILEHVYVSRLQDDTDQQAVRSAMRAAGLGDP